MGTVIYILNFIIYIHSDKKRREKKKRKRMSRQRGEAREKNIQEKTKNLKLYTLLFSLTCPEVNMIQKR